MLSFVFFVLLVQEMKCMSIPESRNGITTRVQHRRSVTNEVGTLDSSALSAHTCQMDCDGQGRLCESIASSVGEKMVCLKNRMQCIAQCSGSELKRILQKRKEKEEKEKEKKTIRKLDSHIYTIEELIKIYSSS